MKMYYDWCKLDENGFIRYCPKVIGNISCPTEETRRANGYKPIVKNPPESAEGGEWVESGRGEDKGETIEMVYEWVEAAKPTREDYDRAMESHLTQERVERGYTTREPSEYVSSSVPRFARDAADWVAHRDKVMVYALGIINAYAETGIAPSLEEFKAALPKIVWTEA